MGVGEKVRTVNPSHRHIWGGMRNQPKGKRRTWVIIEQDILDSYTTFYAAHSKAGAIRETRYHACLPL
jgi:hypothetical protein